MLVLGIETSCDETAAAVVDGDRRILSNVVLSQTEEHRPYGGVVPEIAARSHIEHLDRIIEESLTQAGVKFEDLTGIAVTAGPGLIGGVIVGVMMGKALASALGKPLVAVNHLEGHALTARLTHNVPYPFLLLLISGGHCQVLMVEELGKYRKLGGTLDDALGEAFDKTAKMLGLPYPGGVHVERLAAAGNPLRVALPRPLVGREGSDFSFSGLKTAVRLAAQAIESRAPLTIADRADICASFQYAVADILTDRLAHALAVVARDYPQCKHFVAAGGVASNQYLRVLLQKLAGQAGLEFIAPPPALCTDNAAMIAWAGLEHLRNDEADSLDFEPRARWPLAS